jgi:hypothetical protein
LTGKHTFERHCQQFNVTVKSYHADNGIFTCNARQDSSNTQGQGIVFAAVVPHHQNGVAERCICTLQDMAQTMLIHAHSRWPKAVDTHLWPYVIRFGNDALNATPNMQHQQKPIPEKCFYQHQHHGSQSQTLASLWGTHVFISTFWKQTLHFV